jgi:D-amino-acid dehydrogenase
MSRSAPTSLSLAAGSEAHRFDAVVVCAGVDSAALLEPLGLHIPLAPVYGHSVSAQIREPLNAPRSAVMDERYKVAISRLGLRVRVAGSAELGGSGATLNPASLRTLYKVLQDWFPGAVTLRAGVQQWKGARPMLPDGPPILGASGVPGVWLNLGHGSSGWALSCGSARVLADLIAGHDPGIDLEGLGIERLLQH